MAKLNILVLFGGRSPEHEISIISGIQVLNALDKSKYNIIPVYITKGGEWVRGDSSFFVPETFKDLKKAVRRKPRMYVSPDSTMDYLVAGQSMLGAFRREKVDVVFPVFHGRYGEDGSIQGLFEMNGVAYVGCDVYASSVGMDKKVSKLVAEYAGVPTLPDIVVTRGSWEKDKKGHLISTDKLGYPFFVKPARLGSTIGINMAKNKKELSEAVDVALFYDDKVLVEKALKNAREVNISIIGNGPYELSACEEPVRTSSVLSFEDKYVSKKGASKGMASAKRILPAKIKKGTLDKIHKYSVDFFSALGGTGIARIDFLLTKNEERIYFNEINTMPGSVAFYLWKEKGITFSKLLDKLIKQAVTKHKGKERIQSSFESNVLEGFQGTKLSKS